MQSFFMQTQGKRNLVILGLKPRTLRLPFYPAATVTQELGNMEIPWKRICKCEGQRSVFTAGINDIVQLLTIAPDKRG